MPVSWSAVLLPLVWTLVVVAVVIVVVYVVVRLAARRWSPLLALNRHARIPFRLFLLALALGNTVDTVRPEDVSVAAWDGLRLALRLITIGTGAWLLAAALLFLEDLGLRRYRTDTADNRHARRLRTQVLVIRRLTVALVVVVALGAALLSFPGVRAVGASLLASAGLVSVIAAVAAQSTLANLFAGVQLAFSDAIRIDDVVVVDQQWGRIEEITLSYVVVHLWDDRRLVLPSTYITSKPFENWTRRSSELVGVVELDVDWGVDVDALRDRLAQVLAASDLWDGRKQALLITDATGGLVRVRVTVSAVDASVLFDLRCHVREQLVTWARTHRESGVAPRQRVQLMEGTAGASPP